jgi:hypothetical protein
MRYLIEAEYRSAKPRPRAPSSPPYAAELRADLSQRNLLWARAHPHEVSLGRVPAVLYHDDESGNHGNFLPASYQRIKETPHWAQRLTKVHTSARRVLLSRDPDRCELDSSNSSDALLMNIFCHPATLTNHTLRLLGINPEATPTFGYKPGTPLKNGRRDCTEIDLNIDDLLIEAKLTESNFQTAPQKLIKRYRDLEEVFDIDRLAIVDSVVPSYQLIRGVLAAHATAGHRFCVLCDARRPDLIAAWHRVLLAVKLYDLRCRLQLLTWQELAADLPTELQVFLETKYGIRQS